MNRWDLARDELLRFSPCMIRLCDLESRSVQRYGNLEHICVADNRGWDRSRLQLTQRNRYEYTRIGDELQRPRCYDFSNLFAAVNKPFLIRLR